MLKAKEDERRAYEARMKPIWDAEKAKIKAKENREQMIYLAKQAGAKVSFSNFSFVFLRGIVFFWVFLRFFRRLPLFPGRRWNLTPNRRFPAPNRPVLRVTWRPGYRSCPADILAGVRRQRVTLVVQGTVACTAVRTLGSSAVALGAVLVSRGALEASFGWRRVWQTFWRFGYSF